MNEMQVATALFHACEGLRGREGCRRDFARAAVFAAQGEPREDGNRSAGGLTRTRNAPRALDAPGWS